MKPLSLLFVPPPGGGMEVKMKKYSVQRSLMLLVLSAVLLFVLAACFDRNVEPPVKAGDIMQFGGYDWLVLDVQDGKALVISSKILSKRQYHALLTDIAWEDCDLRKYLNGEFYNSFSAEDMARIAETTFVDMSGENKTDRIFLLSYDEANNYFASDSERIALDMNGVASWWWLRSTIPGSDFAAIVDSEGSFPGYGEKVFYAEGVRPALWLKL